MVIAVDTGNRCMKTAHAEPFSAGLVNHYNIKPTMATDVLCYNGNYYSFSETQGSQREDKTVDDYYYILTLAAIAREIVIKRALRNNPNVTEADFKKVMNEANRAGASYIEDIYLSVGLPPRDMVSGGNVIHGEKSLPEKYKEYFGHNGDRVRFMYNNMSFDISVKEVFVLAQGFAAVFPDDIFSQVTKFPQTYIIDIGGYTTDIALIANRRIDLSFFESLDYGVIFLYSTISDVVARVTGKKNLNGILIEAVLRGESIGDAEVEKAVHTAARYYASQIVSALKDRKIDLEISLPVLVGGGAHLLENELKEAMGRDDVVVLPDVRANAIGYELFAEKMLKERRRTTNNALL